MENDEKLVGQVIGKNYKLLQKLGAGAFGVIFYAVHQTTNEQYAIKIEKVDTPHPQIFFQAKLYQYLHSEVPGSTGIVSGNAVDRGIPRVHYCGTDTQYNLMVMDCLGKSLEDLFTECNRKLSLQTVLALSLQMIERIQFIHSQNFLHRDIQPDNFLMGANQQSHQVYIIDFGLAQRYIGKDGKHIPYKENKSLTGTARYASINTHVGIEQARRDDLESLGYVLMYFLRGSLPWQNMKLGNQQDKYEKIMEQKMSTPTQVLCKGFPSEFAQYMNYSKNLRFEDKPDYSYLKNLFKDLYYRQGYEMDYIWDWTPQDQIKNNNEIKKTAPIQAPSPRGGPNQQDENHKREQRKGDPDPTPRKDQPPIGNSKPSPNQQGPPQNNNNANNYAHVQKDSIPNNNNNININMKIGAQANSVQKEKRDSIEKVQRNPSPKEEKIQFVEPKKEEKQFNIPNAPIRNFQDPQNTNNNNNNNHNSKPGPLIATTGQFVQPSTANNPGHGTTTSLMQGSMSNYVSIPAPQIAVNKAVR